MDKYCSNCGKKINENADICLNCGKLINNHIEVYNIQQPNYNSNQYIMPKPSVPGKGMSIAGMVLGIISAFWALITLLSMLVI